MIVIRGSLCLVKVLYLSKYLMSFPIGKFRMCARRPIGILMPGEDPTNLAGTKRTPRDPLIGPPGAQHQYSRVANFPEVSLD